MFQGAKVPGVNWSGSYWNFRCREQICSGAKRQSILIDVFCTHAILWLDSSYAFYVFC